MKLISRITRVAACILAAATLAVSCNKGPTAISISPSSLTLTEGESAPLVASIIPEDAKFGAVKWTSSDATVATISNGLVTAVKAGSATITASTEGVSGTASVTVLSKTVNVTLISLNKVELAMTVGAKETLVATIEPANATNKNVTWKSSDDKVVTVDQNGNVEAVAAGTADVTVTTEDGGKVARCVITVTAKTIAVTGVSLDKKELALTVDETAKLTATIAPAEATNKEVEWVSSDDKVVSVDKDGNLKALKEGTSNITVITKDGNKTDMCKVTVKAKTVAVTGVSLDKKELALTVDETAKLTATITPAEATNKEVEWVSSDDSVVSVDKDGNLKALKAGTSNITVITKDGGKSDMCAVTVKAKTVAVTGVSLDVKSLTMLEGETAKIIATITPADATNKELEWVSSDDKVVSVDKDGNIKALKAGTSNITVFTKDGNHSDMCSVTVNAGHVAVTEVKLDAEELALEEGETAKLTATVYPDDATNQEVEWVSSDDSVVSVDKDGNLKALKVGTSNITVFTKDGNKSDMCKVTVKAKIVAITDIKLTPTIINIAGAYNTDFLVYQVTPANANEDVIFSVSDPTVCTVDEEGLITAVGPGDAVITVQSISGGAKATCRVYVTTYSLKVLSTDGDWLGVASAFFPTIGRYALNSNREVQFKIFANTGTSVSEATFTHGETILCTSSNASVFSLRTVTSSDNKATIYGKCGDSGACKATITLTAANGNVLMERGFAPSVISDKVEPTGISLSPTSCTIAAGTTKQLTATVTPSDATDKSVTWKSSNPSVATVTSSGLVKGCHPGSATITATTSNGKYSKTCSVTVQDVKVTNVTFAENPMNIFGIGISRKPQYTVTPANATERIILSVPSVDNDILTANWDGEIVTRGEGRTELYANTADKCWTVPVNVWRPTITILRKDYSEYEPPMAINANSGTNWHFNNNTLTIYICGFIGTEMKHIPMSKSNVTVTVSDSSLFTYSMETIEGGASPVIRVKCLRNGVGKVTIKCVDNDDNVIMKKSIEITSSGIK